MNAKLNKVLKIIAITGIVTAGAVALVNSDTFKEFMKKSIKELKKKYSGNDPNVKMRLIAKQLNQDIKNTERRISDRYHNKNQDKYNKIKWGVNVISRSDVSKN